MTFTAGIGVNTRFLGWGCGFVDFDNDGWLDIFLVNGHVYPEVEKLTPRPATLNARSSIKTSATAVQRHHRAARRPAHEPTARRGARFGDFDNDGDVDVVIDPVNDYSGLSRAETAGATRLGAARRGSVQP